MSDNEKELVDIWKCEVCDKKFDKEKNALKHEETCNMNLKIVATQLTSIADNVRIVTGIIVITVFLSIIGYVFLFLSL